MAIESIRDGIFTFKSDVWSYGVLLWEIFTLGSNPYPGIEFDSNFLHYLQSGYRMNNTKYCPNIVYKDIMMKCWILNPDERPKFTDLSNSLIGLIDPIIIGQYRNFSGERSDSVFNSSYNYLNMKSSFDKEED